MFGKFSWAPVIIGWLVIEVLIWLFSHISISFV